MRRVGHLRETCTPHFPAISQKKLMKETSQSDFKPPSVALGGLASFGNTLLWNAHRPKDRLVQKTFCNGAKRKFSSS